jgi:crossover junction endodeoxyribonuclease RuvC
MIILGIDPGYDRLGWGVIEKQGNALKYLAGDTVLTDKESDQASRLAQISVATQEILQKFSPDRLGIESLFFFRNQTTVIGVAQARGVVLANSSLFRPEAKIVEYTPMQIKLAVTGDGHADKKIVEKMLRLQLKGIPEDMLDDAIDALAIALTTAVDIRL